MKRKYYMLIILFVVGIAIGSFVILNNKKLEYKELPRVKLKKQNKPKQFALMLEQDNGEYKESEGELPTEGYVFNKEKSGCTDINGKIINDVLDYDYENYIVLLDTSKTSYCYLYYDIEPNISYLRSKDISNYLTKEITGGMYRYQGIFPSSDSSTMTNWICFGTNNMEECKNDIDKYMYRIIGINPKGQLYLLKETYLKEEDITGFAWNDEYRISNSTTELCPNGICPEWNEADLFKRINGTANGTKAGNGDANDGVDNDTDIFVDSEYYDYLKSGDKINSEEESEWYKLIDTHFWYYGDTTTNSYDGDTLYNIETGREETSHYLKGESGIVIAENYTWTNKVEAKISLMYIHDYAYAYPGGKPEKKANAKNSWIYMQIDGYNTNPNYEWLSTRWGIGALGSSHLHIRATWSGELWYNSFANESFGVRPVFYLTSDIELSGIGTKENPFMIN